MSIDSSKNGKGKLRILLKSYLLTVQIEPYFGIPKMK